MNAMTELVSAQLHSIDPKDQDNYQILVILIIGHKNGFPLLSYLIDTYHRYRLFQFISWDSRCKSANPKSMKMIRKRSGRIKIHGTANENFYGNYWYQSALDKCSSRHGLCQILPMPSVASKIQDSLQVFNIYTISLLKTVNKMIKESQVIYPLQIDTWFIPKKIRGITDDSVSSLHSHQSFGSGDEKNDEDIERFQDRLKYTDNLQTTLLQIPSDSEKIDNLVQDLRLIIRNVVRQQTHKRMVMMIDRRNNNDLNLNEAAMESKCDGDRLYGYLPRNSQNIPKSPYLHESMLDLTKQEILPSFRNGIDKDTINTNTDLYNMFILSIHIHNENEIRMYWHYTGSSTRFFIEDMMMLWPSYFIGSLNDITYDHTLVEEYINLQSFDKLKDPNFHKFYEANSKSHDPEEIKRIFAEYRPKPDKI